MSAATRTIVWALPEQLTLIRDAVRTGELQVIAAGSDTPESAADLSNALGVERIADLRQAVQQDNVDMLWIASPGMIEADARRMIGECAIRTVCSQPQFGSISELASEGSEMASIEVTPLMRRSPGLLAASGMLSTFGQIQSVNLSLRCGAVHGALFGRLYDAMDLIHSLCGGVETISASLAGPLQSVPENPAELRGHLSINFRFKTNRCACAAVSDRAGAWFRGATILGEGGCVRINDLGFEWIGHDGQLIDSHRELESATSGELIGMNIMRLMNDLDIGEPPPDNIALLALCEAARLSCLTGQEESPGKLIEMMSRP